METHYDINAEDILLGTEQDYSVTDVYKIPLFYKDNIDLIKSKQVNEKSQQLEKISLLFNARGKLIENNQKVISNLFVEEYDSYTYTPIQEKSDVGLYILGTVILLLIFMFFVSRLFYMRRSKPI